MGDILDLAVEHQIVDKRGSYYNYGEERLGQGRENTKDMLREHPDLAEEIEQRIRQTAIVDGIMSIDDEA